MIDEKLKQRLVGASVLIGLVVIILPMILDDSSETDIGISDELIPERPEQRFQSRIIPLNNAKQDDDGAKAPVESKMAPAPAPVEKTVAKAPVQKNKPAPTAPVRVGLKSWAVQLGSFSNPENARKLKDNLIAKGYSAFVETVYLDKGKKSRVFVGPEVKREIAEETVKKLQRDVNMKGLVVRYPGG